MLHNEWSEEPPESIKTTAGRCGPTGISLEFEVSEVVVSPFELDIFKEEGRFDNARVRISREAGELLNEKSRSLEPVSIWSGETRISRLFIPRDGLELNQDDANVRLLDELQLAKYSPLNKAFTDGWRIKDIIDYIFNVIDDNLNYNVLRDWKPSSEEIPDGDFRTVHRGHDTLRIPWVTSTLEGMTSMIRNRYGFLDDDYDFNYEDTNCLEALIDIAKKVEIDIFTKDDGIMYVGSHEDTYEIYEASFPPETYNLINYSVPTNNDQIKGVVVKGNNVIDFDWGDPLWDVISGQSTVRINGIALRNDIEEGTIEEIEHDSRDPDALRQVAQSALRNMVSQDKSGNAEIDLLSSMFQKMDQPDIRNVSINDVLVVPEHHGICQDIIPGIYYIDRIHHKINPRSGWIINLGIKSVVTDQIDTAAFGLDLSRDEVIETINGTALYWGEMETWGIPGHSLQWDSDILEDEED